MSHKARVINRDISWLSFNARVLQEANDPSVPLLERIKFLGIYSSNLDEFFRVRVATIKRLLQYKEKAKKLLQGSDPEDLLDSIQKIIIKQQDEFEEIYNNILKELELHGIFIINEKQLNPDQSAYVSQYFHTRVLPTLVPIMVDTTPVFPSLKNRSIYLLIHLLNKKNNKKSKYALIEVPTESVSRFLVIPKENKYIILLDDVIRHCLDDIFFQFEYDVAQAYTVKVTRDAELDIEQDVTKSIVKKVAESVKRRKKGEAVRLVYDETMPKEMMAFLLRKLKFRKVDLPIPGGRYHNFVDFINFPFIGKSELKYKPLPLLSHPLLQPKTSLFNAIKQQDILLYYPYHSFHHLIDLLREASIDPKVTGIKITLYRAAKNSTILNALINAVKNGKEVTVVVELQARFDEEANIRWSNKLQEEGVRIIYGVQGLKVHSKLFLITRNENGKIVNYAHIGTGNFNEDTAKVYTDVSLLTCDKNITEDLSKIFSFYADNYKTGNYKSLVVSPFFMRKKFLKLIDHEIENAEKKKPAYIFLKMNSIVDDQLIEKLYEASNAGVKVKLVIRGICSVVTGVKGMSENIEAISVVDKFLEHSRIFIFCNDNDEKVFISSADWMQRNLEFRSEVAVPINDKMLRQHLVKMMDIIWHDNSKARVLNINQDNQYRSSFGLAKIRSQDDVYKFLRHLQTD
ncbi:MAG: polyphosphate kinase 1 [Bacteroidetes bacterium]|nr:polyphosphate kinase 1 [Bacteroidota bacterium]